MTPMRSPNAYLVNRSWLPGYLVGEIAQMVAMATDARNGKAASGEAAVSGAFASSVDLVAGTRNCLHLLLFAPALGRPVLG